MVIYDYRDGVFSRSLHPTDPSIAGNTVNMLVYCHIIRDRKAVALHSQHKYCAANRDFRYFMVLRYGVTNCILFLIVIQNMVKLQKMVYFILYKAYNVTTL
jgi:hypothetical protein